MGGWGVGQALVVVDPATKVSAAEFAEWWCADDAARRLGSAVVKPATTAAYGPEILDLVVIPVAVNLASSVLYDLVKRLIARVRGSRVGTTEWEITHTVTSDGDPMVVVRVRRPSAP
jgi:hypothetical protein